MNDTIYLAFDIDGTVYDSSDIIVDAYHLGIGRFLERHRESGVAMPGYKELLEVVGIPVEKIFSSLFPGLGPRGQQEMNDLCTGAFVEIIARGGGRIFDGVAETLDFLSRSGFVILAASNGRKEYVEIILSAFGLMKYFSAPFIYTGPGIPDKTAIVKRYLEEVSVGKTLVMIGDRYTDREAAEKNNVPFIGCAFGHAGESEIAGSRWIVHRFDEIPETVRKVMEGR